MTKRLLIADDHGIVRSGMRYLLKDHFEIGRIDEAANEEEITKQVRAFSYDLILLDIGLPGSDFVNLMNWIRQIRPETPVMIFTAFPDDIYGEKCIQLGAKGFINKIAPSSEILNAVRIVLDGGSYISPGIQKTISKSSIDGKSGNPFNKLSVRETEIAILINKGYGLPEICSILNIQYSTANTHKRRIFEKLNISNSVALSHLMHTFQVTG